MGTEGGKARGLWGCSGREATCLGATQRSQMAGTGQGVAEPSGEGRAAPGCLLK